MTTHSSPGGGPLSTRALQFLPQLKRYIGTLKAIQSELSISIILRKLRTHVIFLMNLVEAASWNVKAPFYFKMSEVLIKFELV